MTDVLIIGTHNTAGVLGGLSKAINEHTNVTALAATYDRASYLQYNNTEDLHDPLVIERIKEVMPDLKAVIFNQCNPLIFLPYLDFTPFEGGQDWYMLQHGTWLRVNGLKGRGVFRGVFSTPELTRYADFIEYMPWPLNVPDLGAGAVKKRESLTIGHDVTSSETYREYINRGVNADMYDVIPDSETIKTSNIFFTECRKHGVRFESHGATTWGETCVHKAECQMYFDHIWLGDNGISVNEAAYYNVPSITYMSDHSLGKMREWDADTYPGYNVRYRDFVQTFPSILKSDYEDVGVECGKWVRRVYDPRRVAKYWVERLGL